MLATSCSVSDSNELNNYDDIFLLVIFIIATSTLFKHTILLCSKMSTG